MKFPDTIFVKNHGTETHRDKFDGDGFEIKPGQVVQMHEEAARLCFGFGQEDKLRTLRRLGWVETNGDLSRGLARLNAFSFHESEKAANDHQARKPIAPADGEVAGEGAVGQPSAPNHRPRLGVPAAFRP